MKKIMAVLVLLIPIKVFGMSASSIIGMDLDTGRVLYGYNIHDKRLIASTTKIMTAIVAIENTSNLDDKIEVTNIIEEAYGSAIYIQPKEHISIRDLLYGLMLRSGNDAALAIAESVCGSEDEFVYMMNEYAKNLKMNDTIFYNPHGLEEKNGDANKSSAYDMAKLTKYAMENEIFKEIFKTKKHTVTTDRMTYVWHNKNKLLSLDYITGGKTGFTELARRTLVSTGSKNNINIVVVTLNDPDDWQDHKTIYNKIFNEYNNYKILDKKKFNIKNESYYNGNLYIKNDYYITLTKNEYKKVLVNYNLYKLKDYSDDTCVGYAEIVLDNKVYHKEPIYVKKEMEKEKLTNWQKFKRWLSKW